MLLHTHIHSPNKHKQTHLNTHTTHRYQSSKLEITYDEYTEYREQMYGKQFRDKQRRKHREKQRSGDLTNHNHSVANNNVMSNYNTQIKYETNNKYDYNSNNSNNSNNDNDNEIENDDSNHSNDNDNDNETNEINDNNSDDNKQTQKHKEKHYNHKSSNKRFLSATNDKQEDSPSPTPSKVNKENKETTHPWFIFFFNFFFL